MSDNYKPVSCETHSQYELAIMHDQQLCIHWQVQPNTSITEILNPYDVITNQGAENLLTRDPNGKDTKIRLDKIIEAHIVI